MADKSHWKWNYRFAGPNPDPGRHWTGTTGELGRTQGSDVGRGRREPESTSSGRGGDPVPGKEGGGSGGRRATRGPPEVLS